MENKVSFSEQEKDLDAVWSWYEDQKLALKLYRNELIDSINNSKPVQERFTALTIAELREYFDESEMELEHLCAFNIISATEALLRIDFYKKVYQKRRSEVARAFREIHKKGNEISLERDILDTWKSIVVECKNDVSDLMGLMRYRHWLAHGRYWKPKLGMRYDVLVSYTISKRIFDFIESQHD